MVAPLVAAAGGAGGLAGAIPPPSELQGVLATGTAGLAGLLQGVTGAFKTKLEKQNEERLRRLEGLKERGQLGLSPEEEQLRQQQLLGPVQQTATQLQASNEAALAARGQSTGAELSRIRQETTRAIGGAAQTAQQQLVAEDIQRSRAQKAEIFALQDATQRGRSRRRTSLFTGLSQVAGATGQLAGAPPETTRVAGAAGAPIRDPVALQSEMDARNVPPEAQRIISQIPQENLTRILANIEAGNIGPEEQQLLEAIRIDAASRGGF